MNRIHKIGSILVSCPVSVLELKSMRRVVVRGIQFVNHEVAAGERVGLFRNFGERKVEAKGEGKALAQG